MCAANPVFSAFLVWFASQTAATKRALIKERALAYVDHALVGDVLDVLPPDVRKPAEALLNAIRHSDWKG